MWRILHSYLYCLPPGLIGPHFAPISSGVQALKPTVSELANHGGVYRGTVHRSSISTAPVNGLGDGIGLFASQSRRFDFASDLQSVEGGGGHAQQFSVLSGLRTAIGQADIIRMNPHFWMAR